MFLQSLVEIGPVLKKKKNFSNFFNVFSQFRYHLPLEKGGALHLYRLEFPSLKGYFVPSLVEIGPVLLGKKIFKHL